MLFTACGKTDEPTATTEPVNPGHVSSLPEDANVVNISDLYNGAGTANEAGWIPACVYVDVLQKQLESNPEDESLKLALANIDTDTYSAYLFLGSKFENNTVTYAYEATELSTDDIILVYVTINSDGSTNTTIGDLSDKDQIILGISKEDKPTEDVSENNAEFTESKAKEQMEESLDK